MSFWDGTQFHRTGLLDWTAGLYVDHVVASLLETRVTQCRCDLRLTPINAIKISAAPCVVGSRSSAPSR